MRCLLWSVDKPSENSTASETNSSDVYSLKIVGYVNIPTTPLAIDSMNTFAGSSNATVITKKDAAMRQVDKGWNDAPKVRLPRRFPSNWP